MTNYNYLSFCYRHPHSVLRPERDHGFDLNTLTGNKSELPLAGESREQQNALGPGTALADTPPDAAAEREVSKFLRCLFYRLRFPSFGFECERVVPKSGIAVGDKWA